MSKSQNNYAAWKQIKTIHIPIMCFRFFKTPENSNYSSVTKSQCLVTTNGHWYNLNASKNSQFGVWWRGKLYSVQNSSTVIRHVAVEQLKSVIRQLKGHVWNCTAVRRPWGTASLPLGSFGPLCICLFCSASLQVCSPRLLQVILGVSAPAEEP